MRATGILVICVLLSGCASQPGLGSGVKAFDVCFYTPPEKPGDAGELPDPKGWKLVAAAPADPRESNNPYVTRGCSSGKDCRAYWFQKDTGDIRYCVTNDCWAASADFRLDDGQWREPEVRTFLCTS